MEDESTPAPLAPIEKPIQGWRDTPHLAEKLDQVIDLFNALLVVTSDLATSLTAIEDAATRPRN